LAFIPLVTLLAEDDISDGKEKYLSKELREMAKNAPSLSAFKAAVEKAQQAGAETADPNRGDVYDYDIYNPGSPDYGAGEEELRRARAGADEAMRRRKERADALGEESRRRLRAKEERYAETRKAFTEAGFPELSAGDYEFLLMALPAIEHAEDPALEMKRIYAAALYSNRLAMDAGTVYANLDAIHEKYTGLAFTRKSGWKAVKDAFELSFLQGDINSMAKQYRKSKRPEDLEYLEELKARAERLADNVPKVWDDKYVSMGGLADIGQFVRSVAVSAAGQAVTIVPVFTGIFLIIFLICNKTKKKKDNYPPHPNNVSEFKDAVKQKMYS
jgi:hypothetical protein